eukprot:2499835-Rhodomonas_salina.1
MTSALSRAADQCRAVFPIPPCPAFNSEGCFASLVLRPSTSLLFEHSIHSFSSAALCVVAMKLFSSHEFQFRRREFCDSHSYMDRWNFTDLVNPQYKPGF